MRGKIPLKGMPLVQLSGMFYIKSIAELITTKYSMRKKIPLKGMPLVQLSGRLYIRCTEE